MAAVRKVPRPQASLNASHGSTMSTTWGACSTGCMPFAENSSKETWFEHAAPDTNTMHGAQFMLSAIENLLKAAYSAFERAEVAENAASNRIARAEAAERSEVAAMLRLREAESAQATRQSIQAMIHESVIAEMQVAVRAASEEVTIELRATAEQLRRLCLSTIQTRVDRAEDSISDEVAAAARNHIPSVCSASAITALSLSNTGRIRFEDRGVGTDMWDCISQSPDTPSFTPRSMHCSIDATELIPPTNCPCSRSLPEASSGDCSSLASLLVSIEAGRVYDVASNLEMQCRRNEMCAARQLVGRSTTAAPEMVMSLSDLARLDMGQAVASTPAPKVQLLDLSLAAEPVTPNAVPSYDNDLLDLTQPTDTIATASENILRLFRPPVSSCSMAAPLLGNVTG